MLYYECKSCKGCVGLFGQFVGFIKCLTCKKWIQNDKQHKFQKHTVQCHNCNFSISFEAMGKTEARCVKCDSLMKELVEVKKKK